MPPPLHFYHDVYVCIHAIIRFNFSSLYCVHFIFFHPFFFYAYSSPAIFQPFHRITLFWSQSSFAHTFIANKLSHMKKFQAITRKVVSIKTFARRYSYVDDEIIKGLSLDDAQTQSRDILLTEVRLVCSGLFFSINGFY